MVLIQLSKHYIHKLISVLVLGLVLRRELGDEKMLKLT